MLGCDIDLRLTVEELLCTLAPFEKEVVLHSYGFIDGFRWTAEQIQTEFKLAIGTARINQIKRSAIHKLRRRCKLAALKEEQLYPAVKGAR